MKFTGCDRKGNLFLDLQRLQKNHIFRISVDILQNTNFFRAFTASANVPTIYIQQFWNTLIQDAKSGEYSFQLDEQWFTLNVDLLRKALEITLVDSARPFGSPPAGEHVMDFCLTGKTSGNDKPRHPVLQMLWGIVTRTNVDYAELFEHNIHKRLGSPVLVTGDDFLLGNLKFVPKGEKDEKADRLVDEEDEEPQPALEPQIKDNEYNLKRGIQMSLESYQAPVDGVAIREPTSGVTRSLPVVEGKGNAISTYEQAA
ncbi:hypothetical protein Tco_0190441 [Tanacetum coccineum]